jgi:hypothetical protein
MTTGYYPTNQFNWKAALLGILFVGYCVHIIIQLSIHAQNHGGAGQQVRDCALHGKILQVWQNDYDPNRFIFICALPEGRFGIYILYRADKIFKEVTAFVKDKFVRLEQVEQYLINGGNFPSVLPLIPCLFGFLLIGGIIGGVVGKIL